jgi:phosphotransferase system  glucose/maltose/N-acetylglucosamine-specific IIC component
MKNLVAKLKMGMLMGATMVSTFVMAGMTVFATETEEAAAATPAAPEAAATNPFLGVVAPIVELINNLFAPIMAIVVAVGTVYCIVLGVKFAKAEEPQDHEKAKTHLKNAIIGFVLIFILVVALRLSVGPLTTWMNNYQLTTG